MGTWTKGFKAFDPGMKCRGKQYAENSEYEEPEAEMCRCGMHFCKNPTDILCFYPLLDYKCNLIEIAQVEGEDAENRDCKSVTRHLRIGARLSLREWIDACYCFLFGRVDVCPRIKSSDKKYAHLVTFGEDIRLSASGCYSRLIASGEYASLATSGDHSILMVHRKHARLSASGGESILVASEEHARLSESGYGNTLVTSGNCSNIASSGSRAMISASGDHSMIASSGADSKLAASGEHSIICAVGWDSMAKASVGSWITLAEFDERGVVKLVKTEQVDGERIKADTWYVLVDGEFKEVGG